MSIHASAIATDRPGFRAFSLSAFASWRQAFDHKLAQQLATARLQRFDRRMLADFGAESLARDENQCAAPVRDDRDGLCVLFAATRFAK